MAPAGSAQSGRSSGVEHNLAKVGVEGSNPFARSIVVLKSFQDPGRSPREIRMFALSLLLALAAPASAPPAAVAQPSPIVATASGLRFQTLKPGSGPRPAADNAVLITYEGRLADGKVFDKSEEPVGMMVSGVIPGFQEALLLMNQGGTYRFWIPGALAYGPAGTPDGAIPPNAELDFTVTLIDIGRPAPAPAPSVPPSGD